MWVKKNQTTPSLTKVVSKPGIRCLHNYPISKKFSFGSSPSSQSSVCMQLAHLRILAAPCCHASWSVSACPTRLEVQAQSCDFQPWISDAQGSAWPLADLYCLLLNFTSLIQLNTIVSLFSVRLCNLIEGLQLVSGRVWGSKSGLDFVHQLRWCCEGPQSHLCVRRPQMSSSGEIP